VRRSDERRREDDHVRGTGLKDGLSERGVVRVRVGRARGRVRVTARGRGGRRGDHRGSRAAPGLLAATSESEAEAEAEAENESGAHDVTSWVCRALGIDSIYRLLAPYGVCILKYIVGCQGSSFRLLRPYAFNFPS
jgi:hypothetical protein